MASVMSDSASSDVPDGRELELLVEITTEVDSHLPAGESQWIDLLMTAYDAKVRLLPPSTSTARLFHWVRKIAQLRRPGQRTWDCFKSICEESDIELGFEPSMPEIAAPTAAPRPSTRHASPLREKNLIIPQARMSDLLQDLELKLESAEMQVAQPPTTRSRDVLRDLDPVEPRVTPYQAHSRVGSLDQESSVEDYTEHVVSKPRNEVSSGANHVESVQVPTMLGDRFYPLTVQDFEALQYFSPEDIEEVAVARRHLVRQKAFVAWRDATTRYDKVVAEVNNTEIVAQDDAQMRRQLIAESRSIASEPAQSHGQIAGQNVVRSVKPPRSRLWDDLAQLEHITEEITLEEEAARQTLQVQKRQARGDQLQHSVPSQQRPQNIQDSGGSKSHTTVLEETDDQAIPNAQDLLQQARNVKAELYFEAWRRQANEKAKSADVQFQRTFEMKAELYVHYWRDRARQRGANAQALMLQVKEMKANLVFEEWNKHTRLHAVVEDNDRMYAEQYIVKWHTRSKRKMRLQQLANDHKYQWACEYMWESLSRRKDRINHLHGLVDLVQYYRNAIEPFNTWRTKAKMRQSERLAGAYREARRAYKTMAVHKHLATWHDRVVAQRSLLEHARAEVSLIRAYSIVHMLKRHVQKTDRMNLLVPIAREQAVLLHVENCYDKWRDRSRQWRAMKRIADEMQQERRERVAIEAFRRWRARTAAIPETEKHTLQDQEMPDVGIEAEIEESLLVPQTPQPTLRWKTRLAEAPSTPQTAPALTSRNAQLYNQTPKTAPGPSRFAAVAASTPRAGQSHAKNRPPMSVPMASDTARAPRSIQAKRKLLDPAAAPFRTPRRGRGLLFTDPVFFQKLEQVMPDHALLSERAGNEAS